MSLQQFEKQQYLAIESFRKSGAGVKTPVWFVQEGEMLYVWTETTSGKAKRIRNNGKINIAPCKGDGTPVGEWRAAQAVADESPEALEQVRGLMRKKYGLAFSMFAILGKIRRSQYTRVKIQL